MAEPTTARLAKALAAIPGMPESMVSRARNGYYDDYKSELAFPVTQLYCDLRGVAARPATPHDSRPLIAKLMEDVRNSEYDGTKEEAEQWRKSPEGQETFRQFLEGKP
jgi:hypothetical protein